LTAFARLLQQQGLCVSTGGSPIANLSETRFYCSTNIKKPTEKHGLDQKKEAITFNIQFDDRTKRHRARQEKDYCATKPMPITKKKKRRAK
jgi:hypothetical protein